MSELTYKKIIDVEQVETLNDAATVFINDNGAMKQVAADKFGAVKTVNGVAPDENGDIAVEIPEPVQPDWNQNDENAADYVKNRTHYTYQFRQVIHLDPKYDHDVGAAPGEFYKGGSDSLDPVEKENGYAIGDYAISKQAWMAPSAIIKWDGMTFGPFPDRRLPATITFTGETYPQVRFNQEGSRIRCDITYADGKPHTFEWIDTHFAEPVPLDEKYIPDTIARKSDLEQLGGAFVVKLTWGEDGAISTDKTYEETYAAYLAGRTVLFDASDEEETHITTANSIRHVGIVANSTLVQSSGWITVHEYWFAPDGMTVHEANIKSAT